MTKSTKIIAALGVAAGLGIAALPAGAIFADDNLIPFGQGATSTAKNVTVQLTVGESIALAVEGTTCDAGELSVSDTGHCDQKVAGGTNAVNGFTLSVADADSELALTKAGATTKAQKIAAVDGALTAGMTDGGWNLTGGALSQKAISASAQTVIATNAPKDAQVTMDYNIATQSSQETGTYTDQITYTIAKNQSALAAEEGLGNALVITGTGN